jgi:hypothetical protein
VASFPVVVQGEWQTGAVTLIQHFGSELSKLTHTIANRVARYWLFCTLVSGEYSVCFTYTPIIQNTPDTSTLLRLNSGVLRLLKFCCLQLGVNRSGDVQK